jgi:hypothetical protein
MSSSLVSSHFLCFYMPFVCLLFATTVHYNRLCLFTFLALPAHYSCHACNRRSNFPYLWCCVSGLTLLDDVPKEHSAFIFKGWKNEEIKSRLNCLLPFSLDSYLLAFFLLFCWCAVWSVTLREEQRLRACGNWY